MPTPATRTPVRIARGTYSNLNSSIADLQEGEMCYATDQNTFYVIESGVLTPSAGDVAGPASSTDNAVTRFDLATGKLLQNSSVTISDTGAITAPSVGSIIPFYFADQAAFPSASTYHGAIAHSHSDGLMYYAHGGAWIPVVSTTGTQTLTNKTLTDPAIIGTILEDVFTVTDGAAFEVDPGNGSIQLITLGASRTPKCTNMVAGESVTLMVDDGTAYTITWTDATWGSGGVVWKTNAGAAPTLNTAGYTVIVLWKVSTQVYGARVGDA